MIIWIATYFNKITTDFELAGVPLQPFLCEAHGVAHPARRLRLRAVPAQPRPRRPPQHVRPQGQGAAPGMGGQEGQERKGGREITKPIQNDFNF